MQTEAGRDAVDRFREAFPDISQHEMYYTLRDIIHKKTGKKTWYGTANFAPPAVKKRDKLIYRRIYRLKFVDGVVAHAEESKRGHWVDPVE